jgi:zinc finger CCHC domain-containing protein 9
MTRAAFKPKYLPSSGPPQVQPLSKAAIKRRQRRVTKKERSMICFGCRSKGHSIKSCPKESNSSCYRCGSSDHSLSRCPIPTDPENPTPLASCFVCSKSGHLSKDCPSNDKGLYPHGGGCKFCGSVRHLAQHCNPSKDTQVYKTIGKLDLEQGADDDDVFIALENMQSLPLMKSRIRKKIVSF